MNFIEKIFLNRVDNSVHLQFQRFSKGIFKGRALISAKKMKDKYSISTGAEFANELVREVADRLLARKTNFRGVVVSTNDLTGKLEFSGKKQFQGVKSYIIDKEISGNEVIKLLDEFPKAFFALSCKFDDIELKIKPKAPKSGKPKNENPNEFKANFCKIVTTNAEIGKGFVFERQEFKHANLSHTFVIESIEVPESLKNSEDFSLIREESRRKGKIIREGEIDGEKVREEKNFEA